MGRGDFRRSLFFSMFARRWRSYSLASGSTLTLTIFYLVDDGLAVSAVVVVAGRDFW